jgi:hypothetical protein
VCVCLCVCVCVLMLDLFQDDLRYVFRFPTHIIRGRAGLFAIFTLPHSLSHVCLASQHIDLRRSSLCIPLSGAEQEMVTGEEESQG